MLTLLNDERNPVMCRYAEAYGCLLSGVCLEGGGTALLFWNITIHLYELTLVSGEMS